MKQSFSSLIFSLSILLISGCNGGESKVEALSPITDLNTVTAEQGYEAMYGEVEDSCKTSSSVVQTTTIKPTNVGEKKADEIKKEKIEDDLNKSKYKSCDEILKDYQNIINELRRGNFKPLKDFPIDSDPKIAICKSIDKSFAMQLDSMQDLSSKIIDDL
jgi:hypothetical protein